MDRLTSAGTVMSTSRGIGNRTAPLLSIRPQTISELTFLVDTKENQSMPTTKVEQHQFRWDKSTLTHIPTGATFSWKYPGSGTGDVTINCKNAGDVLPTGEDFDFDEIRLMAQRLMREE